MSLKWYITFHFMCKLLRQVIQKKATFAHSMTLTDIYWYAAVLSTGRTLPVSALTLTSSSNKQQAGVSSRSISKMTPNTTWTDGDCTHCFSLLSGMVFPLSVNTFSMTLFLPRHTTLHHAVALGIPETPPLHYRQCV